MKAASSLSPNKAQSSISTVLFDLDGTLIDHFSAIHRAVAFAQQKLGLPESSYAHVRATVGGSVPITLAKLCGGADHATAAEPYFRQHFIEIMHEDVRILPGVPELLQALRDRGLTLAVLTNKIETHAQSTLEHLGLTPLLHAVFGTASDHPYRKPDPRFTMLALEKLNCASDDCILVGDSPYDFATAEAACIECHLVATGSHDLAQLQSETAAAGIYENLPAFGRTYFHLDN